MGYVAQGQEAIIGRAEIKCRQSGPKAHACTIILCCPPWSSSNMPDGKMYQMAKRARERSRNGGYLVYSYLPNLPTSSGTWSWEPVLCNNTGRMERRELGREGREERKKEGKKRKRKDDLRGGTREVSWFGCWLRGVWTLSKLHFLYTYFHE